MQFIHHVKSGIWESETEEGGYYCLYDIGIWIEMCVRDGCFPLKKVGVRWTIDAWENHCDTFAFLKQATTQEEELWRVEIDNVVTTGWRSGSIGGPNGEQPSSNVWTLWGSNKQAVKSLPLGVHANEFEFSPFVTVGEKEYWDNNHGLNYKVNLYQFGGQFIR